MRKTFSFLAVLAAAGTLVTGCANTETKLGRGISNSLEFLRFGEFQRSVGAQLDLRKFRSALAAAGTPPSCWEVIREACGKFGFHQVRLCLAGEVFEHSSGDSEAPGWTVRVPLANGDYVVLARPFASSVLPMVVAPFVASLRETLVEKFPEIVTNEANRPAAVSLAEQ